MLSCYDDVYYSTFSSQTEICVRIFEEGTQRPLLEGLNNYRALHCRVQCLETQLNLCC